MSALTLSRIQFAFTVGYHFIYVPISIGLVWMVVLAERRYHKSGIEADKAAADFWIKLFTATFAVGVATGITMEFSFGTNWANYSRFVGNIFGAPLAAEGITAFFLESVFLGVLLFGRTRVSRRVYYTSAWLVLLGSHLSALWILVANSWQQTPRGFKVVGGKAVLTDFWAAVFNPSTAPRLVHTLAATWICGSFIVAGISAWYLLKRRHMHLARRWLSTALTAGLIVSVAMPFLGHWHAVEVANQQPVKLAAFEGLYKTQDHAPLSLLGWVDPKDQKTFGIKVPDGLSLLVGLSPNRVIHGLESVPASDRPPEQVVFQTYHLMVALGMFFAFIMLVAFVLLKMGELEKRRWFLWLLVCCVPLPFIAIDMGWAATEIGRQPWVVQGLLRTSDAVSPNVTVTDVVGSLTLLALIYALLFVAWLRVVTGIIRKGPQGVADSLGGTDEVGPTPTATV